MVDQFPSERGTIFWRKRNKVVECLKQFPFLIERPYDPDAVLPEIMEVHRREDTKYKDFTVKFPSHIDISRANFPWLDVFEMDELRKFCWEKDKGFVFKWGTHIDRIIGENQDIRNKKNAAVSKLIEGQESFGLSKQEQEAVKDMCLLKTACAELADFIQAYLEYDLYRDQFKNTYLLYKKEDRSGKIHLNRVEKEMVKICRRNGLNGIADRDELMDIGREAVFSFLVLDEIDTRSATCDTGIAFERQCQERLRELGYEARLTSRSGDFGADLVAEKDTRVYVVQCKWSQSQIGIKAVQEVLGAKRHYTADAAVVVTNSGYTTAATELAETNRVFLMTFEQLDKLERLTI